MMKTFSRPIGAGDGFRPRRNQGLCSAFTLIELLAVISIIAVLAGVFGMALGRGNSSTALPGAQSTLFSLVASARAQAILNQTTARLLVYTSTSDTTHNLNYLQVVYQDPTSGLWVVPGDGVALPSGVYVVPASPTAASGQSYTAVSKLLTVSTPMTLYAPPATTGAAPTVQVATNVSCYYLEFNQFGAPTAVSSGVYGILAISTGGMTKAGDTNPTFNNAQNVRGLMLTQLGAPILLNSTSDFP